MPCPEKPKEPTYPNEQHLIKGSIFWFDLEDEVDPKISSQKARLYIIISKYSHNSSRILISPITDRIHCVERNTDNLKYPNNAPLFKEDNLFLDKDSVVLLDQVYTIGKSELCEEWYSGLVNNLKPIDEAIMYNYDLFEASLKLYEELFSQIGSQAKSKYISQYSRK